MDIRGLSHAACAVGRPKRVRGDGAKIERREEKEREILQSSGWRTATERFALSVRKTDYIFIESQYVLSAYSNMQIKLYKSPVGNSVMSKYIYFNQGY